MQIKPWITAARLRTLPLTVSNIVMGSLIAFSQGNFDLVIFLLGLATAVLLQILSNYANDYGDFVHGVDENRVSTFERALQSGTIAPRQMRCMLVILSFLTLISGISLIVKATGIIGAVVIPVFLILGILCILAAITYTIGKNPYGYIGLGDISVFIFFGIVGVGGIYFLHTGQWNWLVLFPASSFGLLSTGVLNINNIRDIESDRAAGKRTLVIRIGLKRANIYHAFLIITSVVLVIISTLIDYHGAFQWLYLLTVPFLILNIYRVRNVTSPELFDNELKHLSLTSFFFSLTYGIGLVL